MNAMRILMLPVAGFLTLYVLWVLYLAVMALKRADKEGKLSRPARWLGMPVLAFGYFLDAFANLIIMTVILFEFPQEWLVTSRVSRHVNGSGRRAAIARFMCTHLLNPFDPSGKHCKG